MTFVDPRSYGFEKTPKSSSAPVTADRLHTARNAPLDGFHVLLIGINGGVQLRSNQPVDTQALFALIDSLPIRQREMPQRG